MPNEIYHKSNWGNANAEGFGDVYFDAAATNKLYNHSDYYENSNGTDKILRDLSNKASIVLTPTAYSDGSLNTVIPPYQVLPTELYDGNIKSAVNGGTWTDNGDGTFTVTGNGSPNIGIGVRDWDAEYLQLNKTYRISAEGQNVSLAVYNSSFQLLKSGESSIDVTITTIQTKIYISPTDGTTATYSNVSVKEIQEADFDFSRGSSATRVNEQGLVEDVQILSGELVQNGNFEQIGSELVPSIATIVNVGGTITQINGNSYSSTSDGTGAFTIRPKFDFATTSGKLYKLVITPIGTVTGTVNFDFYDGSTYLFQDYDFTTTKEVYFKDNGGVFGAFDGTQAYSVSNFTISIKEVGQNWSFGTGWSMGDGVASRTAQSSSSLLNASSITLTVGKTYKCTMTVSNYSDGLVRFATDNVGFTTYTSNGTFVEYLVATGTAFNIKGNSDFTGSVDNISVVEVTNDTDLPRIDYTSGFGSLLLEPQRTNLYLNSEPTSNEGSASGITYESFTWSLGFTNCVKFGDNSAVRFRYGASVAASTEYTISVFVIMDDLSEPVASTSSSTGDFSFVLGNSVATTVNSNVNLGNNVYKVSATHTTPQASTNNGIVKYTTQSSKGFRVVGWQIEQGSYATSYIPTSGSTVTRSADVANNSGNADLFNDSEGVLYAEIAALTDDNTSRRISISDNSSNPDNLVCIDMSEYTNQIIGRVRTGNTEVAFLVAASQTQTQNNKIALSYKENDFKLFINGTQVATDTSGNTPTGLVDLSFDRGNGNNDFYGNVKCIAVFKEALTDAELESLTSWVSFVEMATDLEYTLE